MSLCFSKHTHTHTHTHTHRRFAASHTLSCRNVFLVLFNTHTHTHTHTRIPQGMTDDALESALPAVPLQERVHAVNSLLAASRLQVGWGRQGGGQEGGAGGAAEGSR
mgnify:CR=1 FL=1